MPNEDEVHAATSAVSHGVGTDKDKKIVREALDRDDTVGEMARKAKKNYEKGTGKRL